MVGIQKYSRLRCLLCVKGLVICFYLGWSDSIIQFRQNIIKVGSKSWLLTCSSNITLSLPSSYTGSTLKRELNCCNGYLSLLYLCWHKSPCNLTTPLEGRQKSENCSNQLFQKLVGPSRHKSRINLHTQWSHEGIHFSNVLKRQCVLS